MATTLPLIAILKTDTRKDGAISYIDARVLLDGVEVNANFRARVGEEPIVIDGDTITVSDAQVAAKRSAAAFHAADAVQHAAADTAKLDAEIAKLDAFLTKKGASPEAAEELRSFTRANAAIAISLYSAGPNATDDRFVAERKAIMVRHGLLPA